MRNRGRGNPFGATGQIRDLAGIEKVIRQKFTDYRTQLEKEGESPIFTDFPSKRVKQMSRFLDECIATAKAEGEKGTVMALEMYKVNVVMKAEEEKMEQQYTKNFYAWLMGHGTPEDHALTPWGRQPHALEIPEVRQVLEQILEALFATELYLVKLLYRTPESLAEWAIYYKYILHYSEWTQLDDPWIFLDFPRLVDGAIMIKDRQTGEHSVDFQAVDFPPPQVDLHKRSEGVHAISSDLLQSMGRVFWDNKQFKKLVAEDLKRRAKSDDDAEAEVPAADIQAHVDAFAQNNDPGLRAQMLDIQQQQYLANAAARDARKDEQAAARAKAKEDRAAAKAKAKEEQAAAKAAKEEERRKAKAQMAAQKDEIRIRRERADEDFRRSLLQQAQDTRVLLQNQQAIMQQFMETVRGLQAPAPPKPVPLSAKVAVAPPQPQPEVPVKLPPLPDLSPPQRPEFPEPKFKEKPKPKPKRSVSPLRRRPPPGPPPGPPPPGPPPGPPPPPTPPVAIPVQEPVEQPQQPPPARPVSPEPMPRPRPKKKSTRRAKALPAVPAPVPEPAPEPAPHPAPFALPAQPAEQIPAAVPRQNPDVTRTNRDVSPVRRKLKGEPEPPPPMADLPPVANKIVKSAVDAMDVEPLLKSLTPKQKAKVKDILQSVLPTWLGKRKRNVDLGSKPKRLLAGVAEEQNPELTASLMAKAAELAGNPKEQDPELTASLMAKAAKMAGEPKFDVEPEPYRPPTLAKDMLAQSNPVPPKMFDPMDKPGTWAGLLGGLGRASEAQFNQAYGGQSTPELLQRLKELHQMGSDPSIDTRTKTRDSDEAAAIENILVGRGVEDFDLYASQQAVKQSVKPAAKPPPPIVPLELGKPTVKKNQSLQASQMRAFDQQKLEPMIDLTQSISAKPVNARAQVLDMHKQYFEENQDKPDAQLKKKLKMFKNLVREPERLDQYLYNNNNVMGITPPEYNLDKLNAMTIEAATIEDILETREGAKSSEHKGPTGPKQNKTEYIRDILDDLARLYLERFIQIYGRNPARAVTQSQIKTIQPKVRTLQPKQQTATRTGQVPKPGVKRVSTPNALQKLEQKWTMQPTSINRGRK